METLALDLNKEDAACLILLLDAAHDIIQRKENLLSEIIKLPLTDRPKEFQHELADERLTIAIGESRALKLQAVKYLKSVGEILTELDSGTPSALITKPLFTTNE